MTEPTDNIIIIYQELFRVKFIHAGYIGGSRPAISSELNIHPDKRTMELFAGHHINYRFFDDVLVCFMECDLFAPPAKKPKIPHLKFTENTCIRFNINASSSFLNITDVAAVGARQVYLFDNQANAATGKFICQDINGVTNADLKDIAQVLPDEKCFGVIAIYNYGTTPGYAVFNSNGTLIDEEDYTDNDNDGHPDADDIPLQFQIKFKSKI